jgi:hypothetical protein
VKEAGRFRGNDEILLTEGRMRRAEAALCRGQ